MNARLHDQFVDARHAVERLRVHAGHDLLYLRQTVFLVAGIDALRAVADLEIPSADQPGFPFEDGRADLLRHARIHRGLEDHDRAGRQVASEQT